MKYLNILFIFFLASIVSGKSFAIDIGVPIYCEYGTDCFIETYYDHSPLEGEISDYTCGVLTKDNYHSTSFKLKNHHQMKEGVPVVAADSGIILAVRDGMSDISVELIGEEAVRGKECGNAIIIDHGRGYKSQYCHLMRDSISVQKNEQVDKGQQIADVGLSGISSFPHLEFTLFLNGQPVDPFTGENPETGEVEVACDNVDIYPLWDKKSEKKLEYISTALLGMGFANKVPHASGAREGKFSATKIRSSSKLIVFWADIFGILPGDEFILEIIDHKGFIIGREKKVFETEKSHIFQFIGQRLRGEKWEPGTYNGRVSLMRQEGREKQAIVFENMPIEIVHEIQK